MTIEKALKFVIGAVARKDHVEAFCHVAIRNHKAIAYDGMLSMSTPIDIGLNVMPHARTLLKALKECKDGDVISLHVTPAGKLVVKSGNFKANVNCLAEDNPTEQPMPSGERFEVTKLLLESIRTLAPLMSIDASRPWAQGLLICGNSTFATNNIILAEHWHGSNFPGEVIIPADAVNELIRIGQPPTHAQFDKNSCTFHFEGDRWLRTTLIDGEWPHERVSAMLDQGGDTQPVPQGFFDQLARLKAFVGKDQGVRIFDTHMATNPDDDAEGARIDFDLPGGNGHFNIVQLLSLAGIAQQIDFSTHPAPCFWKGKMVRGVIIGRSD